MMQATEQTDKAKPNATTEPTAELAQRVAALERNLARLERTLKALAAELVSEL